MKRYFIILLLSFTIISCKQKPSKFDIIGCWQLVESQMHDGNENHIIKYYFGDNIYFKTNNIYEDKDGIGRYTIKDSIINFTTNNANNFFSFYVLDTNKIILVPVDVNGSNICDEGCSKTYEKR